MTTFEITELPKRCVLKMLEANVVEGVQYPVADQANFRVINNTAYHGRPFDSFKYKIYKDNVPSVNDGTVTINFGLENPPAPDLLNLLETLYIFESFFLAPLYSQPAGVDKIMITDITGKGDWYSSKGPVNVGDEFFFYELDTMAFVANEEGLSDTYNVLKFTTSYAGVANVGESIITVKVISLGGELSITNPIAITEILSDVENSQVQFLVSKAKSSVPCKFIIDTTAFLNLNTGNNIIQTFAGKIGEAGVLGNIDNLGLNEVYSETDAQGNMFLALFIKKDYVTTEPIPIIVRLVEVDGTIDNVNVLLNEQTIYIPITPTP